MKNFKLLKEAYVNMSPNTRIVTMAILCLGLALLLGCIM